ncbi:MAG: glycosyltransferase family 2 protein [Alphaproteobacteria bacterium]|nr:glycosyltransferase family 2 protein [Alphaproteobacteria bacterium]
MVEIDVVSCSAAEAVDVELSIVMPCLNEANTVGVCVAKALAYLGRQHIDGEVIVADNGSTDGSQAIAVAHGARIVPVAARGYGNALRAGIGAARGKFVIMGDSDDSYDFSDLDGFVSKLRDGYKLVMGNRFRGKIKPGAMPVLHRYFGNPVLTGIGRLFFRSLCGDFHCGLRGFDRKAILDLDLHSPGMEFASEMVIKASIAKLQIAEVATTLSPDGRHRPPHLRSWHDGWRHLRLLLLFSPRWMFLYPGAAIFLFGVIATLTLFFRDVVVGNIGFAEHTMIMTAAAINIGFEAMLFWAFAKVIAIQRGLLLRDPLFERMREVMPLERGLTLGALLLLLGVTSFAAALADWFNVGFGALTTGSAIRLVIVSSTTLVLGAQILYGSFFLYLLDYQGDRGKGR